MKIYEWETSGGKNVIASFFEKCSTAERVEYDEVRILIIEKGIRAFEKLKTRQLRGKLWEIKLSQNRIMYVIKDAESVYFLHICQKQKGKAEQFELEKAIKRAKQENLL